MSVTQYVASKSAPCWASKLYCSSFELFHDEKVGRVLDCNQALTLTEVTDRMHFPAPPMLTRYLKRTIGKTPSEYRKGQVSED